jgi:hypothetical protein
MSLLLLVLALMGAQYRMEAGQMDIVLRGEERVMQMSGGVRIFTEEATLFSERGEYVEERNFVLLIDSVRMEGKDFEVRSEALQYWTESERMIFSGRVRAEDETRTLETKILEFEDGRGSLTGDVRIAFKEKDARFSGSLGTYNLEGNEAWLFGAPEAVIVKEETLVVRADTFHFIGDTVFGGPNVLFQMEKNEGGGESLTYLEDVGSLFGEAWMSWDGGSARCDSLRFAIEEGRMREVTFLGNVRLESESEDGSLSLEGPWMKAWVLQGELENLEALDLQKGIYADRDKEDEE